MITSPTKTIQVKAVELKGIGKKYPIIKTPKRDINAEFEDFWALKDVFLEACLGEVWGIIGRNGAGKTTLLNIIAGVLSPTEGEVSVKGKVLGLFNLGVGFQDELSGRENIFLNGAIIGAKREELVSKLNSIIEFSELGDFIDMPLGTYSQGMRLRLAFSIITSLEFDILVIDEVLAVGDALFQSKCFERLMDFRRAGKTLVITNQSMDLIERLCDKAVLLNHGRLIHHGSTLECINKYHALLDTEKFFVGPEQKQLNLVENTKKWAEDISSWGRRIGTKEVIIEKVEFKNRLGWNTSRVKSGGPLKIKVRFRVRNKVKEPHFGVAIFRNDGVYCYGPNTAFDGYNISELKQGKGYFELNYPELLLAPGDYRVSVAIWDKNETLAFDYHEGYYKLTIIGSHNSTNELLNQLRKFYFKNYLNFSKNSLINPDLSLLNDKWEKKIETNGIKVESVRLLNYAGEEKDVFKTNEFLKLVINFSNFTGSAKNHYLWVGLYRDDSIYCHGVTQAFNKGKEFEISFPKLPLLPGCYRISFGIWDRLKHEFNMCHHAIYPFRMVFNREDHGTIYLEHNWKWKI